MYPFVGILVSGWMSEDRFEVVVHHCGHFVSDGKLRYDGGERVSWFCDPDTWSYFEILHEVRELGHLNPKELWYSVGGELVLDDKLVQLVDDKGAMHMTTISMINGVVHLYVVHRITQPEVINMIERGVVDNEGDKEVEGDGEVEKELDDEVNGQKETDKEDVEVFDAEVEKELDDDGEKETDKEDVHEDVQEVHAEVEENLHEADEVEVFEVYDKTEDKSDADGEDTRSNVVAEQFCDEGLVDVSVEADEEVEPWMVTWNVKLVVLQKILEEQVLAVNHSVVIQVRMRL